jgi:hypothetical protein
MNQLVISETETISRAEAIASSKRSQDLILSFRKIAFIFDHINSIGNMVGAWCTANGVALGQVQVKEKSNEITAIPGFLTYLGIKGATVTIDAIGCQKNRF